MSGSAENNDKPSGAAQKALPIALDRFLKEIVGTKDEVYITLLRMTRKSEKHTRGEWREILAAMGPKKVTH